MAGLDFSFLVVILVAQIVLIPVLEGLSGDTWNRRRGWVDSALMDNSQAPSSILDTLRTVEFRLGLKGYNVDEVDEYLDKAAQEAEALQEHVRQLNERLRQAERADRPARARQASRPRGRRAEEGAAPLRPTRRSPTRRCSARCCSPRSSSTRRSGRARPRRRQSWLGPRRRHGPPSPRRRRRPRSCRPRRIQKLREEVARLESTRTELAADVESMARHLESERNRLRGALSEILKWVDENVQPANSLMGVKPKPAAANGGLGEPSAPRGGRRRADPQSPERLRRCRVGGAPSDLTSPLRGDGGIAPDRAVRYRHPLPGRGFRQGMGPRRVVRRRER